MTARLALTAILLLVALLPVSGRAADSLRLTTEAVDAVILPAFQTFAEATAALERTLGDTCPEQENKSAFATAFLAWQGVQHIRIGPSQTENRHYRIQFWPDPKNLGARHMSTLLSAPDTALTPEALSRASIAVQGFPALERLLWGNSPINPHECRVAQAIGQNLSSMAQAIRAEWAEPNGGFRAILLKPGDKNTLFRTPAESLRAIHGALSALLQAAQDMKLGSPMGSGPAKPRPERGEAWRAGLPLQALLANLDAALQLYQGPAGKGGGLRAGLLEHEDSEIVDISILHGLTEARRLTAELATRPWKDVLADPAGYRALMLIRANIGTARSMVETEMAGMLGLGIGFNALDGD